MTSSLIFDNTLELCDPDGSVSGGSYWFEALGDGTSWGDPKPVEVALNSLMRDGAITVTTGDENREAMFVVKVRATDSQSLDDGIQALHSATRKRTTLVWTPPDGYGEPRVWDVETSNLLEPNGFDDLAYMLRNEQVFRLRLVCLPYRRSLDLVVDDAGTPPLSSGDLQDDCEDTTGWASWGGMPAGTYSVDSVIFTEGAGSIKSLAQSEVGGGSFLDGTAHTVATNKDEKTGLAIDTDTGGYLSIAIRLGSEGAIGTSFVSEVTELWMEVDGDWIAVPSFVAVARDALNFVQYVWPVDADLMVTGLRTTIVQHVALGGSTDIRYDEIQLLPSATTDHQIVKTLTVQGSARTAGSLRIAAPSESVALGKVLVVTTPTAEIPAGFQPDGARWVTQGDTTVDATALGGLYYEPDATDYDDSTGTPDRPIFDVPVGMLATGPDRPYAMVGYVKAESPPLVAGVQAQLLMGATLVGPTSEAEVSIPDLDAGWHFVPLGTVYLPPLPVQNADDDTKVRLLFKGAKMANVYMIPAWQVGGRAVADFSIVDCGTGTVEPGGASSSLWIDAPSLSQPQGGWWRGPTDDRANAQSAWPDAKKRGKHTFPPGSLTAFLVSTGAAGPTLTLEYFPYWYGSAAS